MGISSCQKIKYLGMHEYIVKNGKSKSLRKNYKDVSRISARYIQQQAIYQVVDSSKTFLYLNLNISHEFEFLTSAGMAFHILIPEYLRDAKDFVLQNLFTLISDPPRVPYEWLLWWHRR